MANQNLSAFLRRTLETLKLSSRTEVSSARAILPQGEPSPRRPSAPSCPPLDPKAVELASLLNVRPEAISIQRVCRNGKEHALYRAALRGEKATLTLVFTPDWFQVCLVKLEAPDTLTPEQACALLAAHGLVCALPTLKQALQKVRSGGRKLIARGRPPRPGRPTRLECLFLPQDPHLNSRLRASFPALASTDLEALPEDTCAVWVQPGQLLACLHPATPGEDGQDVFGRPLPALSEDSPEPVAGPGVRLRADQVTYEATASGYAYVHQATLGVRAPLALSADGLACTFAYVPAQGASLPDEEDIPAWLEEKGICRGIDGQACQALARAFRENHPSPCLFTLAQGLAPEHGRDARLVFEIDCQRKPGRIDQDGRIDFKETAFGLNVPCGALLARLRPATQGRAGFTVRGEGLPAFSGQEAVLKAGANVEVIEAEEEWVYKAAVDGRVSHHRDTLQVHETLHLAADVDYSTGNIDFSGDVLVSGSVLAGFAVRAGGSIAVRGQVESGARLEAMGDIVVGGGAVGEQTCLKAQGNIAIYFAQDATLLAGGDLEVGSYLFNAVVRCQGRALVHQGRSRRSGTIAGGSVLAARGIQARFAGSPNGTATELVVGVDPAIEAALHGCQQELAECEKEQEHLCRLLGLEKVTLPRLRRLLAHAAPGRRDQIADHVRRWQQLERQIPALQQQLGDLRRSLAQPAPDAVLAIAETIYPGVCLRLGERVAQVSLELREACLTPSTFSPALLQAAA